MNDSLSLYLLPPIITIITAIYIAGMGIYRVRMKSENALLSALCMLWSLMSVSYVIQQFMVTEDRILILERLTHVCFTLFPLAHVLFFHRILGIKNKTLEKSLAFLSIFFSVSVFSKYYITGLKRYPWGYFAQGGPIFYLFLVFSLIVVIYIVRQVVVRLKDESNLIVMMKFRYARFSFITAAVLTISSSVAMMGFDVYPPGHFVFIPLGFLGYGILRYRILGSRPMLHITIYWLLVSSLTILPNILVFWLIRPHFIGLSPVRQFVVLMVWFVLTFYFIVKVKSVINRIFNTGGYNLKKVEATIFRDILFLKTIHDLIEEFKGLVTKHLAFSDVDFFLSGEMRGVLENDQGQSLALTPVLETWIASYDHIIDRHMVGTHPRFETMKKDLLGLFENQQAQYMVPLVQHDKLLALAFLKDEHLNRLMAKTEVRFINRLAGIVSISLYNSLIFRDISALKDQLEENALKLSEEIVERKKAEEAIKQSREQYKLLADNVKDTIWVVRADDLKFLYLSPSVRHLLGYSVREMQDLELKDVLTPESFDYVVKARSNIIDNMRLGDGDNLIMELEHYRKDGSSVWVEVSTHLLNNSKDPLCLIGVSRDITERKKAEKEKKSLEAKLMQAQKMESIGVLAGGIAHDFNNILMGILGYTQLARIYIPAENTAAHEKLSRIEKASHRAKDMVAQILAFSRQNNPNKLPVQMAPIIMEALNLLKSSLPSNIKLIPEFETHVPSVMADPVQIHQVIINLCSNASHAMEERGGECRIGLSRYQLDQEEARSINLTPGIYALLSVEDTGCGIDQTILDKIFDPYFTTKTVGKGTGMGLAVVHGIVLNCGGKVRVDSRPGQGTRFELLFPAAQNPVIIHEDDMDIHLAHGQERVLFVDDEKDIAEFAEECLHGLGYQVTTACDGQVALDMIREKPLDFDVVITDLTMPALSGEALATEIHTLRPELPVILCTGYNTYLPDQNTRDRGIVDILIKPVPGKDLAEAIRKALDTEMPQNSGITVG